jgi:hypothetical protein
MRVKCTTAKANLVLPYIVPLRLFAGDSQNKQAQSIVIQNVLELDPGVPVESADIPDNRSLEPEMRFNIFANFVPVKKIESDIVKIGIRGALAIIENVWAYRDPAKIGSDRVEACSVTLMKANIPLQELLRIVPIAFVFNLAQSGRWYRLNPVPLKAFSGIPIRCVPYNELLSLIATVEDGILIEPGMEEDFQRLRPALFPGDEVMIPGEARTFMDDAPLGVVPYGGEDEIQELKKWPPIKRTVNGPYRRAKAVTLTPDLFLRLGTEPAIQKNSIGPRSPFFDVLPKDDPVVAWYRTQ